MRRTHDEMLNIVPIIILPYAPHFLNSSIKNFDLYCHYLDVGNIQTLSKSIQTFGETDVYMSAEMGRFTSQIRCFFFYGSVGEALEE